MKPCALWEEQNHQASTFKKILFSVELPGRGLRWPRTGDPFLSSRDNEQKVGRRAGGELTNEVIRGIAGLGVRRVDSINLVWLHILCNRQGRNETKRSACKQRSAEEDLGQKDHSDLSPSWQKSACPPTELVSESPLTGALSRDELTKVWLSL